MMCNSSKYPSPIEAADAFKANQVDAAVVWSPFDEECIQKVPGSRILEKHTQRFKYHCRRLYRKRCLVKSKQRQSTKTVRRLDEGGS